MGNQDKKTIIFSLGPIYLFWATGIYHIWEISRKYNVVLIAEESFSKDRSFIAICKAANITEIVYLPLISNPVVSHQLHSKLLKSIADKYRPFMILQPNHIYPHNIYLFYWAKEANPKCLRGIYVNGQLRKADAHIVSKELRNEYIESMLKDFPLSWHLSKRSADIMSWSGKILNNFVLPKLFTGKNFHIFKYIRKVKPFIPIEEHHCPSVQLFDFYITYYSVEKEICRTQFKDIKVFQISHPMEILESVSHEALMRLRGYELRNEDIVLILPTLLGFNDTALAHKNLTNWIEAIRVLKEKFPSYSFTLKLHPGTQDRATSRRVTERVAEKIATTFPAVTVLAPRESAEKWIMKSRVIVGDVSTTLWWANYFQSKFVISLNMHDFTGSNEMEYYEGVYYFDTIEKFRNFELSERIEKERDVIIQKRKDLPTLSETIEKYENAIAAV